ncbi:cytochrome b5, heme-binding site-containing protein [Cynara cardunculus var. scolymus]|uniref:Cytochrome b5, heme-binding site-containing protein n=1 Tax=Cynara cardunculus var. scolymus TaxID=59895 RepID=A0A103YEG9_CYNCS|nr:cytochrome b5, heme-binding site-containing protein [Cynara cardunculus var. scolymus]
MATDQKTFVFAEVSKHNKTKDCWVIISGKVYDVTPFMDDHPGGDEVMLAATDKSTVPAKRAYVLSTDKIYNSDNTPEFIKILQFLVPFMILGLAFTVRSYTRENSA